MTPADRNRWTLIVTGLALVVLGGMSVLWFLDNYERRERTVRTGASEEARRNPYLAAERYLRRFGFTVEGIRGRTRLKTPPASSGALVVHDAGPSLPQDDEARLLGWVERGGHLVLVPRRIQQDEGVSARNRLYERFGVRLRSSASEPAAADDTDAPVEPRDVVTVRNHTNDGPAFKVAFDARRYLEHSTPAPQRRLSGEHGAHLLAWERGAGRVTVLSDNEFMLNAHIGERDHAWFVAELLAEHDRVWFLTDAAMPPLTELLWRHAPEAALSSILLALLGLWRAAATHGPRLRPRRRVRRNVIEHLEAVAAFSWHSDRQGHLLHQSRTALAKQWRRRHPQLDRMDEQARCAWIAGQAGLDEDRVRAALYAAPDQENGLVRQTAVQQRLLWTLSSRTKPIEEQA